MLSTHPTWDRALWVFSLTLVVCNLALQALDWITSSIGYYRGGQESNSVTLWLIKAAGNDYVGIGVEKIAYIALFVGIFFLMKALMKVKGTFLKYGGLIWVSAFLIFFIIEYVIVVSTNLTAIGF